VRSEILHEWPEAEIVMISALQHYSYCPRQFALIHVEQVFDENLYTLRGRRVHDRVDEPHPAIEEGRRVERALPLWSERMGLLGKADVVEFSSAGTPYPVEYKSGPPRGWEHDELQLCAQALCLEEMYGQAVSDGAIFHHATRRRAEVRFDTALRKNVQESTARVREMLLRREVPPPVADARCKNCSLLDACMPFVLAGAGDRFDAEELFEP
jgi:CRISPR-associated exonuclease Cas4